MIVLLGILIVFFAVFFFQNQDPVMVNFVSLHFQTRVGLAMIIPLIVGLFVGTLVFWSRSQLLMMQLRNAETRTRSAEGKVREFERQREMTAPEEEQ